MFNWLVPPDLLMIMPSLRWMQQDFQYWYYINIGSGNVLVPSGNKLLPEAMFTQFCDAIWRHLAKILREITGVVKEA